MNQLTNFTFGHHPVRTVLIGGDPHFVASDLCNVLEIGRVHDAVRGLDDDEKGTDTIRTPGGDQQVTVVTEAGMYSLVLRSRKAEAKAFKRWITHEVLPTIRQTGTYSAAPALTEDEIMHRALEISTGRVKALESKVQQDAPKVAAWDSIVSSAGSWSYNDAAKVLCEEGEIQIGEKRLVRQLVEWGYLYRDHKGRPHVYQHHLERGLFAVKARTYTDHITGELRESSAPQVRITGKGLSMIRTRLTTLEIAA